MRDLSASDGDRIMTGLESLPELMADLMATEDHIAEVARRYTEATSAMFVGRVGGYPVGLNIAQNSRGVTNGKDLLFLNLGT